MILPYFWTQEIAELEMKLSDPVGAYIEFLIESSKARKYQWIARGQKVYFSDNAKRFWAINKISGIYGIGSKKTANRDTKKGIFKHADQLEKRLQFLKSRLAKTQNMN